MTWESRDFLVSLALLVTALTAAALAYVFRNDFALFSTPAQGSHSVLLFAAAAVVSFFSSAAIIPFVKAFLRQAVDMIATVAVRPSMAISHGSGFLLVLAIFWLLYRAWQTISIPAPKLMDILRIDVPAAPELVIYDIKTTSASIYWTKPAPGKSVERFRVQINGVIVGETSGTETAATVSGLRPNHFYNLQVIAVGHNNFHTHSAIIRMQTFAENGKPDLGHARVPTSLLVQLQRASAQPESPKEPRDEPDNPLAVPVIESTSAVVERPKATASAAPGSAGAMVIAGQRRGTVNRRHSPSVGTQEGQRRMGQAGGGGGGAGGGGGGGAGPATPATAAAAAAERDVSYAELDAKFKKVQAEKDEVLATYAREENEFLEQEQALRAEKEAKKALLKEKEEKSVRLKANTRTTRDQSRTTTRALEKAKSDLASRKAANQKACASVAALEAETAAMAEKRAALAVECEAFKKSTAAESARLADELVRVAATTAKLETELADKGKLLNLRRDAKKEAAAAAREDAAWREEDARMRREWEHRKRELDALIAAETKRAQQLEREEAAVQAQMARLQQREQQLEREQQQQQQQQQAQKQQQQQREQQHQHNHHQQQPHALHHLQQQQQLHHSHHHNHHQQQHQQQQRQQSSLEAELPAAPTAPTPLGRPLRPAHSLPGIIVPSAASDAFGFSLPLRYPGGSGVMGSYGVVDSPTDVCGSDGGGADGDHDSRMFRAPLSPSAHNLLPSDILNDESVAATSPDSDRLLASMMAGGGAGPVPPFQLDRPSSSGVAPPPPPPPPQQQQQPLGSTPSPHGSAHNLALFGGYDVVSREPSASSSAATAPPPGFGGGGSAGHHKLSSGFVQSSSPFAQSSAAFAQPSSAFTPSSSAFVQASLLGNPSDDILPKPMPSRSFPLDVPDEDLGSSRRRISISGNVFGRSAAGGGTPDLGQVTSHPHAHGRAISSVAAAAARRIDRFPGMSPYGGGERDLVSPRPASIASDPFRPSSDGASIWGAAPGVVAIGDPSGLRASGRLWGEGWHSRNPSRRPSFHASPELKTSLASPDDEILYDEAFDAAAKSSYVGVIGSRPRAIAPKPRLNPAAPTFMGVPRREGGGGDDAAVRPLSRDSLSVADDAVAAAAASNGPHARDASDGGLRKLLRKGSTLTSRLGRGESGLFNKKNGNGGAETDGEGDSDHQVQAPTQQQQQTQHTNGGSGRWRFPMKKRATRESVDFDVAE